MSEFKLSHYRAFVMTRMFESADEAAAYIAAEYARQEPER